MNNQQMYIEEFVTLKNGYKLWTKRSTEGSTPVLIIHGGPGGSSSMLQPIEQELRNNGYQTIVYHQLNSLHSDAPNKPSLWTIDEFTNHLEEVCDALNLKKFVIFGYSWGVVLSLEYALRHPKRLLGMILSNFTASVASFEQYIQHLRSRLSPESQEALALLEKNEEFGNHLWNKIITEEFMPKHFCRISPLPTIFSDFMKELNWDVCQHFFGKNDFVVTGTAKGWDRWPNLAQISTPTLVTCGEFDQCSPQDAINMAKLLPHGTAHITPHASHMPFYENPEDYFDALLTFLENLPHPQPNQD